MRTTPSEAVGPGLGRRQRSSGVPVSRPERGPSVGEHRSALRLLLLLFLAPVFGRADLWDEVLAQRITTGRAVMPLFQPGQRAAVAFLRIGRIGTEYEQHGLFRIGLLPRLVLEDVTLDLRSEHGVAAMVERLEKLLSSSRSTRAAFDLRGFAIRLGTNAPPLVEASLVRGGRNGIRFSDVTLRRADGTISALREARLTRGSDSRFWLEAPPHRHPFLEF